ncbi:MAG: hypothetical protein WCI84_09005, partial [Bacteroidota bacterium]
QIYRPAIRKADFNERKPAPVRVADFKDVKTPAERSGKTQKPQATQQQRQEQPAKQQPAQQRQEQQKQQRQEQPFRILICSGT